MQTLVREFGLTRHVGVALCLLVLSQSANAVLLTFDAIDECCTYPNFTYHESGYTFTLFGGDEGPYGWHLGDGTFVPDTLNWHGRPAGFNSNPKISLTKQDGGLFDLLTLDIDFLTGESGFGVFAISAERYGERTFGVSQVDQTLVSIEEQPLNFLGVSEVVFRHIRGNGVGIDNILVRPAQVPAPSALGLLVIGFAGVIVAGLRRAHGR